MSPGPFGLVEPCYLYRGLLVLKRPARPSEAAEGTRTIAKHTGNACIWEHGAGRVW
jgi:hypothetical protein